jgi:hypothetical protein
VTSILTVDLEQGAADQTVVRPRSTLRRMLTASWVVGIVLFTLARLVVADQWLAPRGLNIWVFAVIDLVTAVPYAVGVAQVATSLIDRRPRQASWWAVVAGISFIAPYLYVAWAGGQNEYPAVIWWVLGMLVVVFGANAVYGITRRVRGARAERLAAA